jgi:hypothetical protein
MQTNAITSETRLPSSVAESFASDDRFDADLFVSLLRATWERTRFLLGDSSALIVCRRASMDAARAHAILDGVLVVDGEGFRLDLHDRLDGAAMIRAARFVLAEMVAVIATLLGREVGASLCCELESIARVNRVLALRARLRGSP